MAGMKSDRARDRAKDVLTKVYPAPNEAEFHRLRELAVNYIAEAERLEAEKLGRAIAPDEAITAALDAIARDYFTRALVRAMSSRALSGKER
jgi:hypothetical protein